MTKISTLLFLMGCSVEHQATNVVLQATEGVVEDTTAPDISVTQPMRGAWTIDEEIEISGSVLDFESGVSKLWVNGEEVTPDVVGDFTTSIMTESGVNTIQILAEDNNGNLSESQVSVMGGTFFVPGSTIPYASVTQVSGPMIDTLSAPIDARLHSRDLISTVGPNVSLWSECAVFDGRISSINIGEGSAIVTSVRNTINIDVTFESTTATVEGDADLCGIEEPFTITATHAAPTFSASLSLSLDDDGAVVATVEESSADFGGGIFASNVDTALDEQDISLMDLGLEEAIANVMSNVLSRTVARPLMGGIEDIIPTTSGIDEVGVIPISYTPQNIRVGESAIAIFYSASIIDDENATLQAPGAVMMNVGRASRNNDAPVASSTSMNLINRAMHSAWTSAALDASIYSEEKGVSVEARPKMPPVMTGGEVPVLRLGEVTVGVYNEGALMTRVQVQASASIEFDVDDDGHPIMIASIDSVHADLAEGFEDTDYSEFTQEIEESIQAVMDAALPGFVQQDTEAASLDSMGAEVSGRDDGWMMVTNIATID